MEIDFCWDCKIIYDIKLLKKIVGNLILDELNSRTGHFHCFQWLKVVKIGSVLALIKFHFSGTRFNAYKKNRLSVMSH